MGICSWCGTRFPKTRATRKYCTARCKTNACLGRKPSRLRAADVQALYALLQEEGIRSAEHFRERLRRIIAPNAQPIPIVDGHVVVPRMD
jgi:hypothetical protein